MAIKTAHEGLSSASGFPRYRVLVCGEAISALRRGSELEPAIRDAALGGIQISACGLSLTELQVEQASLIDSVDVVPNALAEALHLQSLGWASVEL